MKKIEVGILGATGAVGQKLVTLLIEHPWFEVTELVASDRSAGVTYAERINWKNLAPLPEQIGTIQIKRIYEPLTPKLLFSSLDSSIAGEVEEHYARLGHIVISNSKNHRLDADVPLVIPEVNQQHFPLIELQKRTRSGYIVTNPNCVVVVLAIALAGIVKNFGLKKVMVHTMQAISGAGYPGVPSLDILGNIIPFIQDEEAKIVSETLKIFGTYQNNQIENAKFAISAACNRVPVYDGHTLNIAIETEQKATKNDLVQAINSLAPLPLPSAPLEVIKYFAACNRPQPIPDVQLGQGMTVSVGNLRPCELLDWKFTALGHNTIRGAAGAAILNAEYLVSTGISL